MKLSCDSEDNTSVEGITKSVEKCSPDLEDGIKIGKENSSPLRPSSSHGITGSTSFPELSTSHDDQYLSYSKSESDANLTETSWKTANSSGKDSSDSKSCTKSVISVDSDKHLMQTLEFPTSKTTDKTKSLENMQKMPAYGDLIMDPAGSSMSNQNSVKPKDHLYKILVIGDLGTGKTSIIKRYVHQFFSQHYRATIGVDFALKVLNWDANTLIRLQLWDIAGQERYGNMTRVYYKEAVGAFIVFDVTRANTFESVANWKSDLDSKVQLPDGSPIPCVLLANKCDQQKEGLVNSKSKMDDYCKERGFTAWYETSAKENVNIDDAARALVSQILLNDKLINDVNKDGDQFSLANHSKETSKKSCNC